jgi:hypothetical protein
MRVSRQRHAPAALYPLGKDPRYPLDRRLGGPQSRSRHTRLEEKSLASARDRISTALSSSPWPDTIYVCVCVCVCVRARARARACACIASNGRMVGE